MIAACLIEDDRLLLDQGGARRVPWWSFTKTVIAVAALRLAEHGDLDLDALLPDLDVTLRQLLAHTAGLPDYGPLADYHRDVASNEPPWTIDKIIARAGQRLFAPDQGWSYSNIGYHHAGQAIAKASGRPLAEALTELVLVPAGATETRLALTPADTADVEGLDGYHPGWVYHGLLVGPLIEAAQVLASLASSALVSADGLAAMQQAYALPAFTRGPWREPAYGLGLMLPVTVHGWRAVGHTGGGPGSACAIYAHHRDGAVRVAAVWAAEADGVDVETEAVALLQG